jgi:hypothetical protein
MSRDESQDMWVFEDGGDCLGVREFVEGDEYQESEGERYIRFADFEDLKAAGNELAKLAFECCRNIEPIGATVDDMLTRLRGAATKWAETG